MAKVTVEMSAEMNQELGQLAARRAIPKTAVLRRAVALLKFLDNAVDRGQQVLLRDPDGAETRIVFESDLPAAPPVDLTAAIRVGDVVGDVVAEARRPPLGPLPADAIDLRRP